MRKTTLLIGIVVLIITGLGVYSCQKGEEVRFEEKTITLKFELQNKDIKEVIANIEYVNKTPKLVSNELKEIITKDKRTGKSISVFLLKNSKNKSELSALSMNITASSEGGNCQPQINRGYGFDGRCFSYGTFIVTNDCQQYFYPASVTEYIGFDRVCPEWNGAFAKDN